MRKHFHESYSMVFTMKVDHLPISSYLVDGIQNINYLYLLQYNSSKSEQMEQESLQTTCLLIVYIYICPPICKHKKKEKKRNNDEEICVSCSSFVQNFGLKTHTYVEALKYVYIYIRDASVFLYTNTCTIVAKMVAYQSL